MFIFQDKEVGYKLELQVIIYIQSLMKFGFPTSSSNGGNAPYRADTSQKKNELINVLTRSQKLWNEQGKQQESLVQLRKAINLLDFIIANQAIELVKNSYSDKQKQLKKRLSDREQNKEPVATYTGGGGNTKGGANNQNNQLKGQVTQAIVTEKPNVKWEDVSGLENAKNSLKQAVILPIKFPEIFTGSRKPWKGILLYGPPGTGKTYLAKACATEAQGTFFSVSSSDLMSKYVGESEKLIKTLFNLAREKRPSIIFIDQIDSMCGNRTDGENEASRRVKTEFLVQMQGVGHDDQGVLVLGATNLPWALDPAVRRRFERRIYISLPEYEARLGMLKRGMKENKNNLVDSDYQQLAKITEDFSGSDIAILVRDAVYEPVRRLQTATKFKQVDGKFVPCRPHEEGEPGNWMNFPKQKVDIGIVTRHDFDDALKRTKPSVDKKQLKQYQEFTKTFGQDG